MKDIRPMVNNPGARIGVLFVMEVLLQVVVHRNQLRRTSLLSSSDLSSQSLLPTKDYTSMKKDLYCLIIFGLFLTSCFQKDLNKEDTLPYILSLDDQEDIDPETFLEIQKIIPLDFCESCILGAVDKVLLDGSGLYLLDKRISKSIKKFDLDGKLIYSISEAGEGLGKFVLPFDFDLDENALVVLDVNQRKLVSFNKNDGSFIEENRFGDFQAVSFATLGSGQFAYHLDGREFGEGMHFLGKIVTKNDNSDSAKWVFDYGNSDYMTVDQEFTKGEQGILFAKSMNDTIYRVDSKGFHPQYLLDFGDRRIGQDIKKADMFAAREKIMTTWPHFHWGRIFESPNFLFLSWSGDQGKKSLSYYDKEQEKTFRLKGKSFFPESIFYLNELQLMTVVTPEEYMENEIEGLDKEYKNPVIMIYAFK